MTEQKSVADRSAENSDNEDDDIVFEGIDFHKEAENLGESEWFNPSPGTQKIRFLDNGEKDTREYEDEERDVAIFEIKIGGEEKKWSVTVGTTESSLYGQLVKVGADRGGLKGEEVTLIRNGEGADTQYTVQEAADL